MIFQEPMTSLNPLMRLVDQVAEVCRGMGRKEAYKRAYEHLAQVQLTREQGLCYPFELSGGMRQRGLVAMALAGAPELLIADEPTTALDVTIQSQILWLIDEQIRKREMSLLLISHNMGIVAQMCSSVMIMYAGTLVEEGSVDDVFGAPLHPYTKGLLAAVPSWDKKELVVMPGHVPQERQEGCVFASRCALKSKECEQKPPWKGDKHRARCWKV
jgi:oligopeptide/dipeptide ABC transporter ATP-binding protein